ncbi:unnamed protein product [Durusdinium trenchii]|uniref:Uncharacterized protein n=1 Tax=Durusdinium trenchii TaxID=1381693 RepID=A0ABP0L132_9DINO
MAEMAPLASVFAPSGVRRPVAQTVAGQVVACRVHVEGRPQTRRRPLWRLAQLLGLREVVVQLGRHLRPQRKRLVRWRKRSAWRVRNTWLSAWQTYGPGRCSRRLQQLLFCPQESRSDATLLFLLVAKGCPNDQTEMGGWSSKLSFQNRRDSLARCITGALWRDERCTPYSDRACAVMFSGDCSCWLLHADELVASVGAEPDETWLLTQVWRAVKAKSVVQLGVEEVVKPRSDGHLEAATFRFLRSLGPGDGSAMVLLDDRHSRNLPLMPDRASAEGGGLRRAVCVLGCPAGLTAKEETALARAATCAGWQVRSCGLGHEPEFTSKVLARLQVWHSSGRLLPGLATDSSPTALTWPTQDSTQSLLGEVPLHFVLQVPVDAGLLLRLRRQRSFQARKKLALAARCLVAVLCHSKGGWKGCRISLRFRCGTGLQLSSKVVDTLGRQKLALSEFHVLKLLSKALKQRQHRPLEPGDRSAFGVQVLPAGDVLPYVHPLHLQLIKETAPGARRWPLGELLRSREAHEAPDALVLHLHAPGASVATEGIAVLPKVEMKTTEVISVVQSGVMAKPSSAGVVLLDALFDGVDQ